MVIRFTSPGLTEWHLDVATRVEGPFAAARWSDRATDVEGCRSRLDRAGIGTTIYLRCNPNVPYHGLTNPRAPSCIDGEARTLVLAKRTGIIQFSSPPFIVHYEVEQGWPETPPPAL
jgi:hypothetical protein